MSKTSRRRTSIVACLIAAAIGVGIVTIIAFATRPESVKRLWSVAHLDDAGTAAITEHIDYFFPTDRHGIYRVIPDLPVSARGEIRVASDTHSDTTVTSWGSGSRIRIGNPSKTIQGLHWYRIDYPLTTLDRGDGVFSWNGVGTDWDVPIDRVELDVVAPWEWEDLRCDRGRRSTYGGCQISQPEPGHLVLSTDEPLASGTGITITATRGAPLAEAPAPRTVQPYEDPESFWARVLPAAGVFVLAALAAASLVANRLRRAGRDWVIGYGQAGGAASIAYGEGMGTGGAVRIDDTRLDELATTAFAPPRDLTAWQGGVLWNEKVATDHKTAWLLAAAEAGYVELDESDPKHVTLHAREHAPDGVTALLSVAFAGRSSISLGTYDPTFSAMWTSLDPVMTQWFDASGFRNVAAGRRATITGVVGSIAAALGIGLLVLAGFLTKGSTAGSMVAAAAAGIVGIGGLMAAVRSWELQVRTPAGSAMWLQVESFRRFIAGSEAHHVAEAAEQGRLREYTAWAVALGEVDHWQQMVVEAGLPPSTVGLSTAVSAAAISSSIQTASVSPSSSSGGGGVGGGGGGGGGGSW